MAHVYSRVERGVLVSKVEQLISEDIAHRHLMAEVQHAVYNVVED